MTFYILVIILTIYRLPLLTIRTLLRPVKNSYKVDLSLSRGYTYNLLL